MLTAEPREGLCRGLGGPSWSGWRIAALIVLLTVPLALACSSSRPVEDRVTASAEPATVTHTMFAFASAMITSEVQEDPELISSIRITQSPIVLDIGERVSLAAEAFAPDGTLLTDVEFVWMMADPRAGVVTRDGVFRGGAVPGEYRDAVAVTGLMNSAQGVQYASASASVTMVGAQPVRRLTSVAILPGASAVLTGQILRFRAVGFDEDGLVIPDVSFVWELSDPTVGDLNAIGYLVVEAPVGLYESAVKVTGEWGGQRDSATADVSVVATPRADDFLMVQILPQRFFLDPGGQMQLEGVALNGLGELVAGTQLRWSVTDPSSGIIDGNGRFTAGDSAGVFTEAVQVEAVVPGERGYVRAIDVASVVIREREKSRRLHAVWVIPDSVKVARGGRVLFLPQAVDSAGAPASDVVTGNHAVCLMPWFLSRSLCGSWDGQADRCQHC